MPTILNQDARSKVINLFSYFKAVEERKTIPIRTIDEHPWRLRWTDLVTHPSLKIQTPATDDDFLFKFKKPEIQGCPSPSQLIADWLQLGWKEPEKPGIYLVSKTELDINGNPEIINFDQSKDRVAAWQAWTERRNVWCEFEIPTRAALRVWEKIFTLYSKLQLEGESVELVLGDGVFDSNGLHHPILLRRVELSFDPQTQTFTIEDADAISHFYSTIFANIQNAPVRQWQQQLQEGDLHPLGGQVVTDWLATVIGSFKDGQFVVGEPEGKVSHERIGRAPVLFLRKRETGRLSFLDATLNDLQTTEAVSDSLLRIVGCAPPQSALAAEEDSAYANEASDILLSKPANAAQLSILRRLSKRDGVLVQGPPGTGKTHTIANLIGSLLADGKTVLITSHTTKALRVLRQQVAEPLQSLCVSVLDSDLAGKKELESAVKSLANRLDDDLSRLQQEAVSYTKQRLKIIEDLRHKRSDLEMAVNGEYRSLILDGAEIEPVKAAKEVAQGQHMHDWLPGPVNAGAPMPLPIEKIHALYASTATIAQEEEAELAHTLPQRHKIWSPERLAVNFGQLSALESGDLAFRSDLWRNINSEGDLEATLKRMHDALETVTRSKQEPWRLAAIDAGMAGGAARRLWELACSDIDALQREAETSEDLRYRHSPQPPEGGEQDKWIAIAEQIIKTLSEGKTLSSIKLLFNPSWKEFIAVSSVNRNARPTKLEHFQALQIELRLRQMRDDFSERWKQNLEPLGLPPLATSDDPIQFAAQHVSGITVSLAWHSEKWLPIAEELQALGLDWPRLLEEAPPSTSPHHRAERLRYTVLQSLPKIIEAEDLRRRKAGMLAELTDYAADLTSFGDVKTVRMLAEAVQMRNEAAYQCQHEQLEHLLQIQPVWQTRQESLNAIRAVAPGWARAIQDRQVHHDQPTPPGDPLAAWRWKQLSEELNRRAELSIPDLQSDIEYLTKELTDTTISLVESKAWSALIERVNQHQDMRQALVGWVKTVVKIGAGKGKNVEVLRRQARRLMQQARGAVPVWIMPFSRVMENFQPGRDRFDVLIVDEASQEDVVGLAPFYLAEKVIVVGDDEQVTPQDVGGASQPIQDLIGQWLQDLPSPLLFDLKTSIYDRAQIAFDASIRLKEHFRCVPEIIQFSNHLSYGGEIRPLRESSSTPLKPALVAHRVNGIRNGKGNQEEAESIVTLIGAMIQQPEYAGKSIGVMSLMGDEQAQLIERLLRTHLDPVEYERRRILCGTPPQFQGDERDVILLSMVDSRGDGEGPLGMRGDGADGLWKKRYNVAASRAKDQLWVVYSVDHQTQLKPGDLRLRLIEHAVDPTTLMNLLSEANVKTESPFEADVYKRLVAAGYAVTPQWPVGAYRIDLVVEGEQGRRLAIECDGDRWHYNKVAEDLARQALLERLGWRFARIGGSAFYRNKQDAMKPVFEKLSGLGIHPMTKELHNTAQSHASTELLDEIRRRATKIREEWSQSVADFF